jgi:hypothetical protein
MTRSLWSLGGRPIHIPIDEQPPPLATVASRYDRGVLFITAGHESWTRIEVGFRGGSPSGGPLVGNEQTARSGAATTEVV